MANYALFAYRTEQLLNKSPERDDGDLIYEDALPTLIDGSLVPTHYQLSKSQAKAIMRAILADDLIGKAMRDGVERARLNPHGNMPVDGAHPVDPAWVLVKERAVRPVLDALPDHIVTHFLARAYELLLSREAG